MKSQIKSAWPVEAHGSRLARNTLLNLIGLGLPLLVGALTIRVVIHSLGTERFALLSLIWVVFGYFGFLDLGLGRATTKYAAEALGRGDHDSVPKYLWTTVAVQSVLGLLGALILVAMTPLLTEHILKIPTGFMEEARLTFYLISIAIPVTVVSTSFRGVLEAAQRFDLVNAVKIPASTAFYLFPLLGVAFGFRLPGIVIMLVLARIFALLAWAFCCWRIIPLFPVRLFFGAKALRPLLAFGGWVTLSSLIWPVLSSIDRFFIGSIMTLDAVSYYSAPFEVVARLGIIPGSLSMTLFPAFSSLNGGRKSDIMRSVFGRSSKYLFIASAPIAVLLAVFAEPVLRIWIGANFAQHSTLVFQVLAMGFIFNALSSIPYGYLQAIGRADLPTKIQIFELLAYFPLLWGMIHWLGILGAAVAWAIRVILEMGLLFLVARNTGKMDLSTLRESRLFQAATVFLVSCGAGYFISLLIWKIVAVCMATLMFAAGLWLFSFNRGEKTWILSTARNFRAR